MAEVPDERAEQRCVNTLEVIERDRGDQPQRPLARLLEQAAIVLLEQAVGPSSGPCLRLLRTHRRLDRIVRDVRAKCPRSVPLFSVSLQDAGRIRILPAPPLPYSLTRSTR